MSTLTHWIRARTDEETVRAFKVYCASRGITMQQILSDFVAAKLKEAKVKEPKNGKKK